MKISQINIYPIKSLGGINLIDANVEVSGFQYDRNWMLVDQNGKFLTQRTLPEMALLQVALGKDHLLVYHSLKTSERIKIPIDELSGEKIKSNVWDDAVTTMHVSAEVDKWFSSQLNVNCHLVKMDLENKRYIENKYSFNNEHVSFADSMPFLLIGQSSLDDLNSKLKEPLPMTRFRPNIVFTGGQAFAEDDWKDIQIGQLRFRVTKPCARCVMTTINQETGTKGKEPLKTLAQYRNVGGKILFGQNLIALDKGKIAVGEEIKPY